MLAIDTNVVVRFLTGDDPEQAAAAKALVEAETIFLSSTVLLEAEWVLRSAYALERNAVIGALAAFAGLPSVALDDPTRVAKALDWASEGMDFADAIHLASARDCDAFVTFDRRMIAAAAKSDGVPVRAPADPR